MPMRRLAWRTAAIGLLATSLGACESRFAPLLEVQDPTFSIDLRYWGLAPTPEQRLQVEAAVATWESLISRGLPNAEVVGDAGCGAGSPAVNETVDDIVIFVRVIEIQALAESGPCKVREDGGLPITATVWLDGPTRLDDLSPEFIRSLVTHEIGHALGFGSLWTEAGLIGEPSLSGGQDPHFRGANALEEFNAAGGLGYSGKKVPVERTGGAGTADSHWRRSVMGESELMSFTIVGGANPLSRITAAAMVDLGYAVDFSAADDYVLPGSAALAPALRPAEDAAFPRLTESEPRWSISVTDRLGSIVRTR